MLFALFLQLVRWVGLLSDDSHLPETTARVEAAATLALAAKGRGIVASQTGYVQIIDLQALQTAPYGASLGRPR